MRQTAEFLVVIGASAGGLDALSELVRGLEPGLNVAYCVVLHLSRQGIGDFVVHRLSRANKIPCMLAEEGMPVEPGTIYIAPPNLHLLVKDNKFLLGAGPEENRWRPSIDVLLRSAAVAFRTRSIGVILSGLLDDGTSGMWAIKRSGGMCIVQDPNQAEFPDMPLSVINNMDVDIVAPLSDMGKIIGDFARRPATPALPIPPDVLLESSIAEKTAVGTEEVSKLADQSIFSCPDCGGGLWKIKNDVINRYRCHIGHAYSETDLVMKQSESSIATLWVALRMLEERSHLLRKIEVDYGKKGYSGLAGNTVEKQQQLTTHIDVLKKILFDLQRMSSNLAEQQLVG